MLNIISSNAGRASGTFTASARADGDDNLAWLRAALAELGDPDGTPTHLLLIGGRDQIGFRLRVAQAHLRHDMTPSHWSHALLLGPIRGDLRRVPTYEVSLDPPPGFGMPSATNALQTGRLSAYADADRYPNVALLRLPVDATQWQRATTREEISVLERFEKQRSVLDVTELVLQWLGFLWGVGQAANPLLQGYGVPSAAAIEAILNAVGYDLTPALESRASCPEAIWQAAKWWHPYFLAQTPAPIEGRFHVGRPIDVWPP